MSHVSDSESGKKELAKNKTEAAFHRGDGGNFHFTNPVIIISSVNNEPSTSGSQTPKTKLETFQLDEGIVQISDDIFINIKKPLRKGMNIYEGYQEHVTGQKLPLAIKAIVPFSEKSIREVDNLVKLASHPNVVRIIQSKVQQTPLPTLYIAMELCSPLTLQDYLNENREKKSPFDFEKAMSYSKRLIRGMKHIHGNRVIHGDLKPENILFSLKGDQIKVADFGLSKQLQQLRSATQMTSGGTHGYRAPETYNPDAISMKADIYSLGVTLYSLFTNGEHPFGEEPDLWMYNIKKNRGRDLSGIPEEMGDKKYEFLNILDKMLEFDPKKRPTIEEISKHQFFSGSQATTGKGEGDQVKCWYCDGGVHSWAPDDVPWVEHARWFPACEFLLRAKGQGILQRRFTLDPLLPQPTDSRLDRPTDTARNMPEEQNAPGLPSMLPTLCLKEADSEERLRKVGKRVENIMQNSRVVKTIINMGFGPKIVAILLRDRILSGNEANPDDVYEYVNELLDDVQEAEKARKKEQRNQGSKRMYICDQQEQGYLVDTGAVSSILPATIYEKENLPRRPNLKAANGSVIATYGKREMVLKLSNNKTYKYDFVIANVDERIVGANFLHYHKLDVQLSKNRLKDPDGSYINGTRRSASASTISSYAETSAEHLQGEEDMDEEECPSFSEISSIDSPFSNYSGVPGSDDEDMDESVEGTSSSIGPRYKTSGES